MSDLRDRIARAITHWCVANGEEFLPIPLANAIMREVDADRAALVEALRKYGEHKCGCDFVERIGNECTCGLDAALAGRKP